MRGHNIVADGWAGVTQPQPNSPPYTNTKCDGWTNVPMDGPIDRTRRTDKALYRVACLQLKKQSERETPREKHKQKVRDRETEKKKRER